MSHGRKNKPAAVNPSKPFSYRVPTQLAPSFEDIVTVSQRPKASILHESLEAKLPALEVRYAPQLKKLRDGKRKAQAA